MKTGQILGSFLLAMSCFANAQAINESSSSAAMRLLDLQPTADKFMEGTVLRRLRIIQPGKADQISDQETSVRCFARIRAGSGEVSFVLDTQPYILENGSDGSRSLVRGDHAEVGTFQTSLVASDRRNVTFTSGSSLEVLASRSEIGFTQTVELQKNENGALNIKDRVHLVSSQISSGANSDLNFNCQEMSEIPRKIYEENVHKPLL